MDEKHKKRSSSGDFEFGCFTPDSPSQDRNSPADHLFFNGRLLPHSFPCQQQSFTTIVNISRVTSRTSSVSSKDSLMSSRSNSTNSSRSSSCSSARTSSSSESSSERKMFYYSKVANDKTTMATKIVTAQLYGTSQRWQHLTPVPVLKRETSGKRHNCGGIVLKEQGEKNKKKSGTKRPGIFLRFFMSFLFACRECHAMEPSSTQDDDILQGNVKL